MKEENRRERKSNDTGIWYMDHSNIGGMSVGPRKSATVEPGTGAGYWGCTNEHNGRRLSLE